MVKLSISVLLILLLPLFSCSKNIGVNCDECYQEKPDSAYLVIELSIDEINDTIPVIIYRGDIESDVIEYELDVWGSPLEVFVPVEKKYSVTAEYQKGHRTIIAVDATKLRLSKVTDECDVQCWVIKDDKMNACLKY